MLRAVMNGQVDELDEATRRGTGAEAKGRAASPKVQSKLRFSEPSALKIDGFRTASQVDRAATRLTAERHRREHGVAAKERVLGHARKALEGFDCVECREFFARVCQNDPDPEARRRQLMKHCKHRARKPPPATPDGYWTLTFPETQTQPPPGTPPAGTRRK